MTFAGAQTNHQFHLSRL